MIHNPHTQPPKNEIAIWASFIKQRGTPSTQFRKIKNWLKYLIGTFNGSSQQGSNSVDNFFELFNGFLIINSH